jgi:hypothetical protein
MLVYEWNGVKFSIFISSNLTEINSHFHDLSTVCLGQKISLACIHYILGSNPGHDINYFEFLSWFALVPLATSQEGLLCLELLKYEVIVFNCMWVF